MDPNYAHTNMFNRSLFVNSCQPIIMKQMPNWEVMGGKDGDANEEIATMFQNLQI